MLIEVIQFCFSSQFAATSANKRQVHSILASGGNIMPEATTPPTKLYLRPQKDCLRKPLRHCCCTVVAPTSSHYHPVKYPLLAGEFRERYLSASAAGASARFTTVDMATTMDKVCRTSWAHSFFPFFFAFDRINFTNISDMSSRSKRSRPRFVLSFARISS